MFKFIIVAIVIVIIVLSIIYKQKTKEILNKIVAFGKKIANKITEAIKKK